MNNSISDKSYRSRRTISTALKILLFVGITCVIFVPILVTVFASIKTQAHIASVSPMAPPPWGEATVQNYITVFKTGKLGTSFKNSAILVAVSVLFNIVIGSVTAYCLERFDFKLKPLVYALFMLGMIIPSNITEIARFHVISAVGAYRSLAAPIIIYACGDLMQLYIYRQFIRQIPKSLDESAMLDGCGYFRTFGQIIFPLLLPASATLAIIKAVDVINDMYIPYLYMPGEKLRTLTTMLMSYSNSRQGSWTNLAACIVIVMIPTIIIFLFFQRYIFAGIVAGAVKE